MFHVMISKSDVVIVDNWKSVQENKKRGFDVHSGSSSIKSATEMENCCFRIKFDQINTPQLDN
ncbi:hypothetical protein [Aneurinibacillus tyrosinisolvens]|uniref:hypothetical protein n=1 Tax=Aneurinibacillus tyrosinisolvens TaxID=1443435 RepID=UPI00063F4C12|nr:hypothetical protein [Aneurinibacillus tyrosinisolvens]